MDDVVFVHPPSIYDFRRRALHFGPISDVVPSLPIFDMYPIGFLSLSSYLLKHGFRVSIVNLAALMARHRSLDVRSFLSRISGRVFAVDLHWLVHVHGALNIIRLLKEEHPDTPVVVGGLSSTFYFKELLSSCRQVDFVVLGDTVEDPFLALVQHLVDGRSSLESIPNIAWRENGRVRVSKRFLLPKSLDKYAIDYSLLYRRALTSLHPMWFTPFTHFVSEPIGAVLAYKGCMLNCIACGGSRFAFSTYYGRSDIARKSPKTLWEELKSATEYFRIPVFIVQDVQWLGRRWVEELVKASREDPTDSFVFLEFFKPPPRDLVLLLKRLAVGSLGFQISPESQSEEVRTAYGREYDNRSLESFIENSLKAGVDRLDVYFMIGLPLQDRQSAMGIPAFMRRLYREYGVRYGTSRLQGFVAPLAPFVDPGSLAYTYPERCGYRLRARTLQDHYHLLDRAITWKDMLNYETLWMTRSEIVRATYDVAQEMLKVKMDYGLVGESEYTELSHAISEARQAVLRGRVERVELKKETVSTKMLYPSTRILKFIKPKLLYGIAHGLVENACTLIRRL